MCKMCETIHQVLLFTVLLNSVLVCLVKSPIKWISFCFMLNVQVAKENPEHIDLFQTNDLINSVRGKITNNLQPLNLQPLRETLTDQTCCRSGITSNSPNIRWLFFRRKDLQVITELEPLHTNSSNWQDELLPIVFCWNHWSWVQRVALNCYFRFNPTARLNRNNTTQTNVL